MLHTCPKPIGLLISEMSSKGFYLVVSGSHLGHVTINKWRYWSDLVQGRYSLKLEEQYVYNCSDIMRGSRNFRQGGPGQSVKESSDNVFNFFFIFYFLVLSLFYWSQMVNFEENYHFSRFQRGSNIFQGGVQLFPWGSNCLFPIETHTRGPEGPEALTWSP